MFLIRPVHLVIVSAFVLCPPVGTAVAQTTNPRFEVGGHVSTLRLSDADDTAIGFGGRFAFGATRALALEAEFDYFPHDELTMPLSEPGSGLTYVRRRYEGVFGAKVGGRRERFGVFGRVRPGFSRLTHRQFGCTGEVCVLILPALPIYRTEFVLDLGGTLEVYPSRRTVARVDIGTTIIRHREGAPPCVAGGCTSQNLSSAFGLGFRF